MTAHAKNVPLGEVYINNIKYQ